MEGIEKIMNSIKVMKLKKDDILVVKLNKVFNQEQIAKIREQVNHILPKDLNIKVIFSNPDIDFEILRRNQ